MLLLGIIGLFLCFGYMTGTDWREYEKFYTQIIQTKGSPFSYITYEVGYWLYQKIFVILKVDFWHFFIFTKIVLFIIFIKAIKEYCPPKYFWLAMTYFIPIYGFSLFIDNPMRNVITIAIFLWSFKYIINRSLLKFILCTIIAISIHYSAIVLLLFYFFYEKKYRTSYIIIVYVILNILFLSPTLLYGAADFLLGWIPPIGEKIQAYSSGMVLAGKGKLFSLGFVSNNIIFILLISFRKNIEQIKYGNTFFIFAVLYLIFYRMGLTIEVLGRFQLYLCVFFTISLVSMISAFTARSKILYACYIFFIALIPTVYYLRMDYRYVPYTNYLHYIGKKVTYEERSNYNKLHSPYKDNMNKK